MGCNASVSNEVIDQITEEQIQEIKDGTILPVSYQFFLNNFYFISRYDRFYTELPLDKQLLVLENVGPLSKEECKTVVEHFCKNAESEEELVHTLIQVSRKMICKTKMEGHDEEVYIPVGLEKSLWNSIMQKKYETKFGKFKMNDTSVDWTNSELIQSRDVFLGDLQNQISQVPHTKDLSTLMSSNPIDNIWKKGIDTENISQDIDRNVSKPLFWEPNIHEASLKGKKSSVQYNLALIPQMFNLPDSKDNTPVHYAAMGNQKNVLIYLKDIGADFKLSNSDGLMPIHLVSKKSVVTALNDLGININDRNSDGESLLDIKTRFFDKAMIKTMIGLGVNILEPNPNGVYWIQNALHNAYFESSMTEEKFINFVRKLLISNKKGIWNYNPIYIEVIQRKDKTHVKEDLKDLNESALTQNIERIGVLLAIGTKPDVLLETGETNLYLCSKRGLVKSVEILVKNHADPNFTNSQHENCFWVAAINEHFDSALILSKNGANMDIIDKNNETLMHNVYRRKITKIFDFVLEAGASPNIKNGKCQTVTFIAFLTRDDQVAEKLQDQYKGDINAQDHKMWSLVHHAFSQGDLERIEYLANRHIDMNLRNNKGHSVLMMAFFTEINFQTWTFLLDKGASINTVDYQNNSMLHHLFFMKNPREDVFRFLLDHKIDYDIENNHGQFAISIAIEMSHDKFGFELLNLNCKILDQKSIHEPICEALKRGSSKWFEALVDHGADAMNEQIGVISRYINSGFFKYKVFKKIPRMNIFLEAPLQMAIYRKFNNCAADLWNMAKTEDVKIKLAANKDCYGRVLISAAIIMKNEKFVNVLLNNKYDITTIDNDGKTPFIHACKIDVVQWMVKLFELIPLSNANIVDNSGCSALTYAAENNEKDFCDYLFCSNIEVQKIVTDSNGIIQHYRNLLRTYHDACDNARENYDDAKSAYYEVKHDTEECEKRRRELESEMSSINSEIRSYNNDPNATLSYYYDLESRKRQCEKAIGKYNTMAERIQRDLNHANDVMNYYERKYDEIIHATRSDILHNIDKIESLGDRDVEIGKREFYIDWEKIGAIALGILFLIL